MRQSAASSSTRPSRTATLAFTKRLFISPSSPGDGPSAPLSKVAPGRGESTPCQAHQTTIFRYCEPELATRRSAAAAAAGRRSGSEHSESRRVDGDDDHALER